MGDRNLFFSRYNKSDQKFPLRRKGEDHMAKCVHFNIEGAKMDLPTHYDERSKMDIEQYPDLIENPVYTPKGDSNGRT